MGYSQNWSGFWCTTTQTIMAVQVTNADQQDILCWTLATSGQCTSKEAYKILALQMQQPIPQTGSRALPPHVLILLQAIWKHKTLQPKYKTFAYRTCHRQALATAERVGKYSRHIDQNCKPCGPIETDTHSFFQCPFPNAVWFTSTSPVPSDALPQGQQRGCKLSCLHFYPRQLCR